MGILGEVFGAPVSKANRHHFRGGDAVPESTPSAAAMGSAYIGALPMLRPRAHNDR